MSQAELSLRLRPGACGVRRPTEPTPLRLGVRGKQKKRPQGMGLPEAAYAGLSPRWSRYLARRLRPGGLPKDRIGR
jgi:hypothetical protein